MYESWFKLSKRPFGAAPQVADYYPSQTMETARQALVRCIECSAGPSIIVAGTGCGKTTLCLKLQEHFRDTVPTAYVGCCGIRSRRELLQNVLFAFNRPYEAADDGELQISLTNFVRACEQTGVILIVDDVDDLPVEAFEELRSLSNLTSHGTWCINIVMAGKNKLEELLARPGMESLEQRIASRNYLASWNGRETAEYVQFQISRGGGDAQAVFSTEAIDQIHTTSDGVPRLVNQLCDHALIMAALGNVEQLDGVHVEEAWADLQQLPAPSRQTASTDESASMIEFGTLDEEDTSSSDAADPAKTAAEGLETTDNDCSQEELPCGEAARSTDVQFGELGADEETEEAVLDRRKTSAHNETSEHRIAHDATHDLVDRLDDIEREVERVSSELHGEPDSPPRSDFGTLGSGNPFLEVFDEEELIFSTHNTMNNELVYRQPTVFTPSGESLINVMRMVDQGMDSHNDWERLEDICGSPPADEKLSLELTSVPLPAVRHEPEIVESNCGGAEFSDGEFTFNYAVPMDPESDAHDRRRDGTDIESDLEPSADDFDQDNLSIEQVDEISDRHDEDQTEADPPVSAKQDSRDSVVRGPFGQLGVEFVPERNFEDDPPPDLRRQEVEPRETQSPLTIAPVSPPKSFVNNTDFGAEAEFVAAGDGRIKTPDTPDEPVTEAGENATSAAPTGAAQNGPVAPSTRRGKFNSLFSNLKSSGS